MAYKTIGEVLDKIDSMLDEVDELVRELDLPNRRELSQKIYDFYAAVERSVEETL